MDGVSVMRKGQQASETVAFEVVDRIVVVREPAHRFGGSRVSQAQGKSANAHLRRRCERKAVTQSPRPSRRRPRWRRGAGGHRFPRGCAGSSTPMFQAIPEYGRWDSSR